MALIELPDWLDEHTESHAIWYAKRLTGNDTLANGTHQAGPYIPKEILFDAFPSLMQRDRENPDIWFRLFIDSHPDVRDVRAVWYNNKLRRGTRNEARLTNFGGSRSPLLDPESTGSLAVFVFHRNSLGEDAHVCHVWVCDHPTEADLVEERLGPVEPGSRGVVWKVGAITLFSPAPVHRKSCRLGLAEMPEAWLHEFPSGADIVRKVVQLRPAHGVPADSRLIRRRQCELDVFFSVEEAIELPRIRQGYGTMEEFVSHAQTILQRRKARSGRSLELHVREILIEEGFTEHEDFSHQAESENGKEPDFLFPSQSCYQSPAFPDNRLRMLAVKTTCRDRWRQILNEADRVKSKHLLTLQQGVSEKQFGEMKTAGVQLVVPTSLINYYPRIVRPFLQTLESFIGDIRVLNIR